VSIAPAPQTLTKAPNGPRKPQNPTVRPRAAARSAGVPPKVVWSTSAPLATPASVPPR
jgi:hypothetical protein